MASLHSAAYLFDIKYMIRFVLIVSFAGMIAVFLTPQRSIAAGSAPANSGAFGAPLTIAPDPAKTHVDTNDGANTRYGPVGLFDHRSVVGTGFYPEPFLVDEGDVDREVALKWVHQEEHHAVSDGVTGEVEWSFGQLTFELEMPYERDYSNMPDPQTGLKIVALKEGIGSPQIAIRHPVWEWVSAGGKIDNAVVAAFEVALPSNSRVGKETETVPGVFDLLRLGDHFGFQTHLGLSTLYGSDADSTQTFEYSGDFSYDLDRDDIPLPDHVLALVPIFEVAGERQLNNGDHTNRLSGVVGAKINLDAIGPASPRLGVGYVFPIDRGARDDFSWGVVISVVFDL